MCRNRIRSMMGDNILRGESIGIIGSGFCFRLLVYGSDIRKEL